MTDDGSPVARTLRDVRTALERRASRLRGALADIPSVAVGIVVAGLTLVAFVVPENYRLVRDVVVFGDGSLSTRFQVFGYLFPGIGGFDPFVDGGLLAVSLLAGLAIATVVHQIRMHGGISSASSGVGFGLVVAVVGGGCGACGTVIVAGALGAGATGFLAMFPYGGAELPWIAAGIVLLSLVWITGATDRACPVDDR